MSIYEYLGFMVNYNDIAGSFAGLVFGMANTFGTLGGIIAPYMVGYLTPNVCETILKYNKSCLI
jgi:hypothetical protein